MSSVIVQHQNGRVFDLDKLGYHVQSDFAPFGTNWTHTTTWIGKYKNYESNAQLGDKTININFVFVCHDMTEYQLKCLDLTKCLSGAFYYWIYLADVPNIRWWVTCEGQPTFTPVGNSGYGTASFTLKCPKGLGESTHHTGELHSQPANLYDNGFFGLGNHFPHDGEAPRYQFSEGSFRVFNPGSINLTCAGLHGKIIFSGGGPVTMTNSTTQQTFSYKQSFGTLILDGYLPFADGKLDYKNSNHSGIDLKRGWNEISVSGCSSVEFDETFYY